MPGRFIHYMQIGDRIIERITDAIAIVGIASWLSPDLWNYVKSISEFAGLLMPIFGCSWLGVQIYHKLFRDKT